MQKECISIIMPFKNTAKYLPETIESILDQTEQNWELIAVNDHSTDESADILNDFAKKDKRIQVHLNKKSGIIPALQYAYSKSSGEYITRMDSDDLMPKNKLKILKQNLTQSGTGHLATGLVHYFSEGKIGDGYQKYEHWLNSLTQKGTNFEDIYKECVIPSPCWMVHRSDFDQCGAFNSEIYPEDYDLTFRFYQNGLKVIPSKDLLHLWRDHTDRTSRNHENYAYNAFIDLKVYHFLKFNYDQNRPLILWGAGKKGKKIAELLIQSDIDFHWICDNPKKIGKHIYDKEMLHWKEIENHPNPQSIVSVASPIAQKEIKQFLVSKEQKPLQDFFFFC